MIRNLTLSLSLFLVVVGCGSDDASSADGGGDARGQADSASSSDSMFTDDGRAQRDATGGDSATSGDASSADDAAAVDGQVVSDAASPDASFDASAADASRDASLCGRGEVFFEHREYSQCVSSCRNDKDCVTAMKTDVCCPACFGVFHTDIVAANKCLVESGAATPKSCPPDRCPGLCPSVLCLATSPKCGNDGLCYNGERMR